MAGPGIPDPIQLSCDSCNASGVSVSMLSPQSRPHTRDDAPGSGHDAARAMPSRRVASSRSTGARYGLSSCPPGAR